MSVFLTCRTAYIELLPRARPRFSQTRGGIDMKRSLDIAAIILTTLLLLGFAVLSLRGLIDPQQASARFGAPVSDAAGALFYRVYLSRNLVIVAAGAVFLFTRQWKPLAMLLTVTA